MSAATKTAFSEAPKPAPSAFPAVNGFAPTHRRATLVEKIDRKTAETVTLSKGTLWLLGAAVVILNLAFTYGGSLLGWSNGQERLRMTVEVLATQMTELNRKVDAMQEAQRVKDIKDAEKRGYELKAAEGDHNQDGRK